MLKLTLAVLVFAVLVSISSCIILPVEFEREVRNGLMEEFDDTDNNNYDDLEWIVSKRGLKSKCRSNRLNFGFSWWFK